LARKKKATASPETASGPRDYVEIAKAYAKAVLADRAGKRHGELIKAAARRFQRDLKRARQRGARFKFDPWHANDACDFIEKLPHVEGVWDTPNIELHPSHVFFVVQLFGFRKLDGTRRFSSALFWVARKNAKSTLAAGILLYCQCCEDEPGAQIISAATTGSQARIIFNVAKKMAEKTADLREAFGLECWANSISRLETGSSFKPINAKASTQDGLNPSHIGLDEIHAHKTADLVNVLASAAGARRSPLTLYTTTEGYESPGPWADLRMFATQMLQGVFGDDADHFLAVCFTVDKDDEDFDETAWMKANPLAESNPHLVSAIRREAIEARQMPSKLAEFRIKRLNRRASSADGLINILKWNACDGPVDLDELEQYPCWGGLDLASTTDLCAWRLVWRLPGQWVTWGRRWVPMDAVKQRTARGTVPYAGWVERGLIVQTPGDVTDYAVVERDLIADCARFKPQAIAYDSWNAQELAPRLAAADLPMVQFIQGPKSYHPAMQELERAYLSGALSHGGDPVLAWCASNLVARRDENLNMAPSKKRSPEKIDDICALLMAMGAALASEQIGDLEGFLSNPVIGS
jgi:phage terminase large subunit-like protein